MDVITDSCPHRTSNDCQCPHWRIVPVNPLMHHHRSSRHSRWRASSNSCSCVCLFKSFLCQFTSQSAGHVLKFFCLPIAGSAKSVSVLLSCFVLIVFLTQTMAAPVNNKEPHWIDPCRLNQKSVLNPADELKVDIPDTLEPKSLYQKIFSRSEVARKHAVGVRKNFVSTFFYYILMIYLNLF